MSKIIITIDDINNVDNIKFKGKVTSVGVQIVDDILKKYQAKTPNHINVDKRQIDYNV